MATLVTPAFVRKAASSPRPRLVVGNLFLVTLTSPPGSLTRVAATTLSRCTSRPAALSACCFMSPPPLLVQAHAPALAAGRGPRWKRNLGFVLVATLVGPHGPAPDFDRARGCKKDRRPHPTAITRIPCLGGDPRSCGLFSKTARELAFRTSRGRFPPTGLG